MTDGFSRCMALLDEVERTSRAALTLSAQTTQERSLVLGRIAALYAALTLDAGAAAAGAVGAALELQEREPKLASNWFG